MAYAQDKYNKILIALDGTETQNQIFKRGLALALSFHADLILAQVVDMSRYDLAASYDSQLISEVCDYAGNELQLLAAEAQTAGVENVEVIIKYGTVKNTLVNDIILPNHPDMVICGDRGLSRVQYALLGSVSNFVVHNVECDVLIVKN
ncbi:MAG: universal stress protein [Coriobacteriia bacterium]|nr:universal stress protein [Coriobacteriia bacterium]